MIRATSLAEFYAQKYEPLRLIGCSVNCKRQYRSNIRRFGQFLGHQATTADLDDDAVTAFMASIADEGRSVGTINTVRKQIISLWRFAAQKGWVQEWPNVRRLIEPERIPQAWLTGELAKLFAACQKQRGWIEGIPAADYWTALHWVWWCSGERRSASMSVEWPWVDLDGGTIYVPAEARKWRRRDRLYPLKAEAVAALAAIRLPARTLVFPWPHHMATFYNRYRRILRTAGLPTGRLCGPQRMRRSFASHLEAAGGNATEALDHSTRVVTRRSYLDPRIVKGQNAAAMLPSMAADAIGGSRRAALGSDPEQWAWV